LLEDRQAIWQAWFTNDRSRLELLLPNSVIAITNGDTTWQDRSAVLGGRRGVCAQRRKNWSASPFENRKAVYGDVAILYSTYVAELETEGPQVRATRPGYRGLRLAERCVAKCRLAFGYGVLRKGRRYSTPALGAVT